MGQGGATYAGAGVDIAAGDAAVERLRSMVAGIGGFGGQFPLDTDRFTKPVLVASTDGVGTKLVVARATGRYDTVGIDLVAMCVDDLVCVGAEPLFMLDYIATGKVDPDQVATVVAGVHEGCRQAGCALIGGETAEHAGVMAADELDLAGFARRRGASRAPSWGPRRVRAGDAIVGLASPGLRSNGYTLARHVLLERAGLDLGDPAWEGADHSVADELLRPSLIYTPAVLAARAALGDALHGCAHITGGGIVGNLPRALPDDLGARLDRSAWEEPRVFAEIQRLGAVEEQEMDRVFNRGVGMALVVEPAAADAALGRVGGGGPGRERDRRGRRRRARRADRVSGGDTFGGLRDHLLAHSVKTGDFTLKSGRKSSWFIDSKQTVCRPEAMLLVADAVLSVIPPEATAIGGLTMGADPVAFVTAGVAATRGRPLKAFSVRKEAKDHGGGGRIAGALDPGDKVVVTEDTVTRGTSLLEAAHAVQEAGGEVVLLVAVVDRGGTVEAMAAAEGIPFRAILTAPDLGFAYEGA